MLRRYLVFAFVMSMSGFAAPSGKTFAQNLQQKNYLTLSDQAPDVTTDITKPISAKPLVRDIVGRKIPETITLAEMDSSSLSQKAIPLPDANTLAHLHFQEGRFGRAERLESGVTTSFIPQIVLVKFRKARHVAALRVQEHNEVESLRKLAARTDVEFAELDVIQQRQFTPNDTQLTNQWHHARIGSFEAWEKNLGDKSVRIAIVDTPFQMDHPDLAANSVAGWDVVNNQPITSSAGIIHSTIGAGIAAAVIHNQSGVAGAGNCSILPININGAISEMYNAVIWAADNEVRIVNLSWTGADSSSLNEAGRYLREKTGGVLAMAGVNGTGFLNYPNHPYITSISMTDAADNMRSRFGDHIDFAAPGYQIFSTSTGSSYASDSGTSYATPLFCGVLGVLFSINPTLSPEHALELLQNTAVDKGQPGWDQFFGWGRIDFAAASEAAQNTLPKISSIVRTSGEVAVSLPLNTNFFYSLWKTESLSVTNWFSVTNLTVMTNGNVVTLRDPNPTDSNAFYRVRMTTVPIP